MTTTVDGQAVVAIRDMAVASTRAMVLSVPGEAPGRAWIQHPGKDAEMVELGAKPRAYIAFSIDALCQQLDHFAKEAPDVTSVVAFVGRGRIGVHLDESEKRLDTLSMALALSKPFAFVQRLASGGPPLSQKDVLWLLRTEIGAEKIGPDSLLATLKALKFSRQEGGDSNVQVGRESMGRQVMAEVTGGGKDIPDSCTLTVPVYADLLDDGEVMTKDIECAIDVNVAEATFIIKPLPGEVERAQRETDERICEIIRAGVVGTNITVFNGSKD